jgi:hypothetical protein
MPPIDPFHLTPQDMDGPAGRACSGCGYDLRGIPMSRPCPECGLVATSAAVEHNSPASPPIGSRSGVECPDCGAPTPGLPIGALCRDCARSRPATFAAASDSAPGESARPCGDCGYDLQGTPLGCPCPECGFVSTRRSSAGRTTSARPTILKEGERSFRITERFIRSLMFRAGLLLLLVSLIAVLVVAVISMGGLPSERYLTALITVAWGAAAAAWLVSPATLDVEHPIFFVVRWGARVGLACWPLGLWIERIEGVPSWGSVGMEFAGLCGAGLLLANLASIANELEIKHTARRLTTTIWLLGPVGLWTWLMPFPESVVKVDSESAFGMVAALFVLLCIGPWFWVVLRTARSVMELLSMGTWSGQAHHDAVRRDRAFRARVHRD